MVERAADVCDKLNLTEVEFSSSEVFLESKREAENIFVMTGDRLQIIVLRRAERFATFPGVLDRPYDPEIALGITDDPVLRAGAVHEDGYLAAGRGAHCSSLLVNLPGEAILANFMFSSGCRIARVRRCYAIATRRDTQGKLETSGCLEPDGNYQLQAVADWGASGMAGAVSSAAGGRRVDCPEARTALDCPAVADESDADESAEAGARMARLQVGHDPACPAMLSSTWSGEPQ